MAIPGRYATAMPKFGWLNDADAAALLTYLRSSFGNRAPPWMQPPWRAHSRNEAMSKTAPTAIHRMVERCRANEYPAWWRSSSRLGDHGERQVLSGYCLLLPDPWWST